MYNNYITLITIISYNLNYAGITIEVIEKKKRRKLEYPCPW